MRLSYFYHNCRRCSGMGVSLAEYTHPATLTGYSYLPSALQSPKADLKIARRLSNIHHLNAASGLWNSGCCVVGMPDAAASVRAEFIKRNITHALHLAVMAHTSLDFAARSKRGEALRILGEFTRYLGWCESQIPPDQRQIIEQQLRELDRLVEGVPETPLSTSPLASIERR